MSGARIAAERSDQSPHCVQPGLCGNAFELSVGQTVRATGLVARDRQPAPRGRCSTPTGLTSSDHPDPRGLHPGLFYSTLSASSVSIAAAISEASPPPVNQWTERRSHAQPPGAARRTRPRRQPAPRGRCSTPTGLTSSDHPDSRGLHPGLFYSTLSASSVSIAAGICEASPPPVNQWTERRSHVQPPGAAGRTRPRRQPAPRGRCSTPTGLTSSDHPDSRGLHPGLFYSTLSASSVSIAAAISEASPPPVNQWTERHGYTQPPGAARRTRPRRQPAPRGPCSTPTGLTSSAHPDSRGLHPGLFYPTLSASSVSIAAGICEASPPPVNQWTERRSHAQPPGAANRTRPQRGSNRSARGANPGEDRICRKAQPCKGWTAIT